MRYYRFINLSDCIFFIKLFDQEILISTYRIMTELIEFSSSNRRKKDTSTYRYLSIILFGGPPLTPVSIQDIIARLCN